MEDFLIYLIKSSGVLAIFWCCHKLFLEKETLFALHRVFLASGILIALLFPLWTLTEIVLVDPLPFTLEESATVESIPINTPGFDWWNIIAILYAGGVLFFLGRLGMQLLSLRRLIKQGTIMEVNAFKLIESKADTSPFSFFNLIVYNPALHQPDELEKILAHEKIHALQWHSLDILLVHLFSAFQWVNPFVWLYKKSVSQNLEYIADQCVSNNLGSSKEYQYLLLKNASAAQQYSSIINPFFTSSIKKRIVMLNKSRSNNLRAWKFTLVVPFLAYFLVAFNTKTVTQVSTPTNLPVSTLENNNTDTTKVEFTIYKTSTPEDLEKISNTLKKNYSVSQTFADIERNQNGAITNISSSFTVSKLDETTMTGTNTFKDLNGIKPFSIYIETDKDNKIISMGHESEENDNMNGLKAYQQIKKTNHDSETIRIKASATTNNSAAADPLIIIDAMEVSKDYKVSEVDPKNIHSINVVKGITATNIYGEKAKNGAIEITTKNYQNAIVSETTPDTSQNNPYIYIKSDEEPLFIIDGVEKDSDFDMGSILPSTIESIDVLKGEAAFKKYGIKGKKSGVVEITTKKSGWKVQSTNNNAVQPKANWTTNVTSYNESNEVIKGEDGKTPNSKWKVGYGINTNDPDDILNISSFRKQGMEKAVVFVNGVNQGKDYVPTMKYSEIESIGSFAPGESTSNKYGKLGKHGVIEIATKKE